MRSRVVLPEILDELPAGHPDAVASRRDLVRINRIMGNYRWIQQMLTKHGRAEDEVVELGGGDGILGSKLTSDGLKVSGIDFAPRPGVWPETWPWIQGDILEHLPKNGATIVMASLILHHFEADQLSRLGKIFSEPSRRLLIFAEPARRRIHHWQGKALGILGLNRVTRHDMHVSIDAGFLGNELADLLKLDKREWKVNVTVTLFGAYRFLAVRR